MCRAILLAGLLLAAPVAATAYEETACGDAAIQTAQARFERTRNYAQAQNDVSEAVAHCPKGTTIVMLQRFAGTYCDLNKSVVDTGYSRVACVKR
jgi:hypothetical protein